jgi:hypothetical protein
MRKIVLVCLLTALAGCRQQQQPAPPPELTLPARAWDNAAVGDSVTIRTASEKDLPIITRLEVLATAPDSVTIRRTVRIGNQPPASADETYRRDADPSRMADYRSSGTKLPPQTLEISGKQVRCNVYELKRPDEPAGASTSRMYLSPDVPGLWVRQESPVGNVAAEVVEFTKK